MTTETTAMTAEQIDARLREIAPPPEWGTNVTAEGVARYFAVCAMLGYTRNLTPFIRPDQEVSYAQTCAQFATALVLLALDEENRTAADEAAREIADTWCDGEGVGGWLHENLAALGVDPDEIARLDAGRLALHAPVKADDDELTRLRRGGRELGRIVVKQARTFEAARIEMLEHGPAKAMEWILNSIPDVSDEDPGLQWDGHESATAWLDRVEAADRAAEAEATP